MWVTPSRVHSMQCSRSFRFPDRSPEPQRGNRTQRVECGEADTRTGPGRPIGGGAGGSSPAGVLSRCTNLLLEDRLNPSAGHRTRVQIGRERGWLTLNRVRQG